MRTKNIVKLSICLVSCTLILTFTALALRPMPLSPGLSSTPPILSSETSRAIRIMVLLVEGSDISLLDLAKPGGPLSPLLLTKLSGPDDPVVALASIVTGLPPAKLSALSPEENEPEPFWWTAMRQGFRAAVLFWPEIYPDSPFSADYTVAPELCYGSSQLHTITFTEAISPWASSLSSFSPPLEGIVEIKAPEGGTIAYLRILALDTTDDGKVNHEALIVEGNLKPMRQGEWLSLKIDPHLHSGAFFKLLELRPDRKKALLYRTPICYNYAAPPPLLRELNEELGFFPPFPDPQSTAQGWIKPEDVDLFQRERASWTTKAITIVWDNYRPDLLLARFNLIRETATLTPTDSHLLKAYNLTGESLRTLAEMLGEKELLIILSPPPEGFLALYGKKEESLESPYSFNVENVVPLILSFLSR
ncbi:MAG: hypothetical protein RMK30_04400 [Anaerolineae bacterium]|nr:alkaline phosphatase family protein [Anaerolineae bacterium]MDW8102102.1 hypothetical protein [Anaerolineae bacterium]